jgi:hypothetical protein
VFAFLQVELAITESAKTALLAPIKAFEVGFESTVQSVAVVIRRTGRTGRSTYSKKGARCFRLKN